MEAKKKFILKELGNSHSIIYSRQKFYYMPGTRLDAGEIKTNKRKFIPGRT